jgi:undecaprenyl pyrophosphate phosphatase UppP
MTSSDGGRPTPPVIRYAPLGELKVYLVYEHELETLAEGSPASLFLNFALTLLPISVTLTIALLTTEIASRWLFDVFVLVCLVTLVSGVVLLVLWVKQRTSAKRTMEQIKNRMPLPGGIQETAN